MEIKVSSGSTQSFNADSVRGSLDLEIKVFGIEERLRSSSMATWRERLKISSGSPLKRLHRILLVREEMEAKHVSGN
ncbi:hypothetical protein U1Q18_010586 [Sarracenia purpurea var. burkii]